MAKVTMPQLGESVAEGTIGKWLKQPGDHVAKYEPLVEVVTDKVNAEVPSPFEGILREILAEEGAVVPNNAEIAVIETADDGAEGAAASAPTGPVVTSEPPRRPRHPPRHPRPQPTRGHRLPRRRRGPGRQRRARPGRDGRRGPRPAITAPANADPDARMTPAVRRLLREHDLSPAQIQGTGGGGRITRDDVLRVVESIRTGSPAPAVAGGQNGASAPRRPRRQRPAPARPGRGARATTAPGRRPDRVPGRRRRSPPADDPDAQGHRRPDDPRPGRAARVRPDGGRRHDPRRVPRAHKRDYQAREGISLSYVPFVVKAVGRRAQAQPDVQRPLDRQRPAGQASDQHRASPSRSTTA